MRLVAWAKTWATKATRFWPLTRRGSVLLFITIWVFIQVAAVRSDYVLQVSIAILWAILALEFVWSVMGTIHLRRHLQHAPIDHSLIQFEAGRAPQKLRSWTSLSALGCEIQVVWLAPLIKKGWLTLHQKEKGEWIWAEKRAAAFLTKRRFRVEGPLGLVRWFVDFEEPIQLQVFPWSGKLHRASQFPNFFISGEGQSHPFGPPKGDPVDLRQYHPKDSLRRVHWKIFARRRELMVRTEEQSRVLKPRVLAYLIRSSSDEAAAACAWAALWHQLLGEKWQFGMDGELELLDEISSAGWALCTVRDEHELMGRGLARALARTERNTPLVIFVSPSADESHRFILAALRQRPVTIVLCFDNAATQKPSWFVERIEHDEAQCLEPVSKKVVEDSRAFWKKRGAQVVLWERSSGQVDSGFSTKVRHVA